MQRGERSGEPRFASGGKLHSLGYYAKKEEAIKARIEGERKCWDPMLEKKQSDAG